ncbi:hypothetical protein GQ53DRAFT_816987 [Thozetella sp. PMI_491]|nr:hypothetical protein GQ53DRAFT_816987 [Thozetella sp. PMI_491]
MTVQNITASACKSELDDYKTGNGSNINRPNGGNSALVTPLIDCILNEFPESRKTELAASAVILGLLPTILQSLGSTLAETGLLSLRGPLLAILIALGSTTVAGAKSAEFTNILRKLVDLEEHARSDTTQLRFPRIRGFLQASISVLETLAVGGAVANMVYLSYILGVHADVVFARETVFLVPLWTLIAAVIHIGGIMTVLVRVRLVMPTQINPSILGFAGWAQDQFTCCAFQTPRKLEWKEESLSYHSLTYLIELGTVAHVVFGTLVLSGLISFSVVDAVHILGRYAASALVCRAVLQSELLGMTETMAHGFKFSQHEGMEFRSHNTDVLPEERTDLLDQPHRANM